MVPEQIASLALRALDDGDARLVLGDVVRRDTEAATARMLRDLSVRFWGRSE